LPNDSAEEICDDSRQKQSRRPRVLESTTFLCFIDEIDSFEQEVILFILDIYL